MRNRKEARKKEPNLRKRIIVPLVKAKSYPMTKNRKNDPEKGGREKSTKSLKMQLQCFLPAYLISREITSSGGFF